MFLTYGDQRIFNAPYSLKLNRNTTSVIVKVTSNRIYNNLNEVTLKKPIESTKSKSGSISNYWIVVKTGYRLKLNR